MIGLNLKMVGVYALLQTTVSTTALLQEYIKMTKRELYIEDKPHFGFRVLNKAGDAELGNYHIADFSWKEDAEFFVKMQEAAGKTK